MQSHLIRSTFLNYFRNKGHRVVPSASLVPGKDPTLLFTNSGMVQFKDVFLGQQQVDYTKAVTAQRCLRAGGKHNDLDNVGYTPRHHTFFEMLGNFSFGEYFKDQAIAYSWEFVTKVLKLPQERLWITIYHEDNESEKIWLEDIKASPERFSRLNESNFWQMGDIGPCGPCSEIFYDHGPDVAGGPPGTPGEDGDRYVEIWNLVFIQYQRDAAGELTGLERQGIDTGMGLERIAAVMQGEVSNYATDLFVPLIEASCVATGCTQSNHPSVQVIADHLRSSCFLLLDGVTPSNEGRGYVLRRIIRRAIRHGHSLGCKESFFHQLTPTLVATMSKAVPELKLNQERICKALQHEEEQFQRTLGHGMAELEKNIATLSSSQLPGDLLFRLYDTFGFPVDMVGDIARERDLTLDLEGFNNEMARQRAQSRKSAGFSVQLQQDLNLNGNTHFTGYDSLEGKARISYLLQRKENATNLVDRLNAGTTGVVILDRTPFYAEGGGQTGDQGVLITDHGEFVVEDTTRHGELLWHHGCVASGHLDSNTSLQARVDSKIRASTMRNHSATHLLHAALRLVLGDGVMQRGSLVNQERLRFDFSHTQPLSIEQLNQITHLVNEQIVANLPVFCAEMSLKEATAKGALAFFAEKYSDEVRVISMGRKDLDEAANDEPFSVELCGGTHATRTGDIGCFHIASEGGIASGVRRIEALTGMPAMAQLETSNRQIFALAEQAKTTPELLPQHLAGLQQQLSQQAKKISSLQAKLASLDDGKGPSKPETLGGFKAIIRRVDATPPGAISQVIDKFVNQLSRQGVVVLAGDYQGKAVLAVGVTADATKNLNAGKLLGQLAPIVDGKGGGKPHFAQGGGTRTSAIEQLLEAARTAIASS